MSDYISREELLKDLYSREYTNFQSRDFIALVQYQDKADVRENIHGEWLRMSDLPEYKDDRYKCSRCGNVVHYSNGVNLYHFNSWCGRCGSLNNSLIAQLEPYRQKVRNE